MLIMKRSLAVVLFLAVATGMVWVGTAAASTSVFNLVALEQKELLGKLLFFDTNLSKPKGQSCAACHAPGVGFTGADPVVNATIAVYPGAIPTRFGNRKPPSAAYAGGSPLLHYDQDLELWVGGMFWDGRATGRVLGDPLAEQAQGPFLNHLEQNNPSAKAVVDKVLASSYRALFKQVCGTNYNVGKFYNCIARSIAAYERSEEVNPFNSKYDHWLAGKAQLTAQEESGRLLFEGKGACANCHISRRGPNNEPPLFTDFTYDNVGVPRNPLNPIYYEPAWNTQGTAWVDKGLGGFLESAGYPYVDQIGKFKVPTLRNVARRPNELLVKNFGHNGYFKSLKATVHFYNTRDVLPSCADQAILLPFPGVNCWPEPEISANMNTIELGNLGLTDKEEDAIVAFLATLSDTRYRDRNGF